MPTATLRYCTQAGETMNDKPLRSGTCNQCGIEHFYPPKSGHRIYCSVQCRDRRNMEAVKARRAARAVVTVRECLECGESFEFKQSWGNAGRRFCSSSCAARRNSSHSQSKPKCVVDGCVNSQQYAASGLCNSCYYRHRRTGTLAKRDWRYRSVTSHGYVKLAKSDHILSTRGFIYEHRRVLYDAIGAGPHPCHWCGSTVNWLRGSCVKGSLVPDHLDGNKLNNDITNLVPACNRCNANRGLFMAWVRQHKDDPYLWAMYEESLRKASA